MANKLTGGDKLEQRLKEIAARLGKAKTVRVGFLENATYPDGTPVALVAATNEFGGTVTVPAHETAINRKVGKNGEFAKGGKFVKEREANFQTVHQVDEYTVTIPARPFFRSMVERRRNEWPVQISKVVKAADYDAAVALDRVGQMVEEELQESIREFSTPPNAASTVRKKGFNDPLIDSSHMLNSTDHEVNT